MVATLRVMLDQLVTRTEPDLAEASGQLAHALVLGAPAGCEVEAILPAGGDPSLAAVPGISGVRRTALPRRELATALQLGVGTGIGGGMIHSPSLFAPLVRHDRVHDNDQTVVTVWDLRPWEAPDELPRAYVAWHRGMLKRAAKHADAVVVPTHEHAVRLADLARLGDRRLPRLGRRLLAAIVIAYIAGWEPPLPVIATLPARVTVPASGITAPARTWSV